LLYFLCKVLGVISFSYCITVQSKASWIASSFGDFSGSPGFTTTEQLQNKKWTKTRSFTGSRQTADNEKLWVNKYSPGCITDLAVNKKKIASVQEVLERSFKQSRQPGLGAPIILLTGETGTGKSTTLRLLVNDLHAELKEWVAPAADQFVKRDLVSADDSVPFESQWSKFCDFLFRANRYSSLALSASDIQEQKKIILIEEFPHVFTRNVDSFHSVLRRYRLHGRCPLVFILGSSDGGSLEHLLFPKSLQSEISVETISFNAAAPTILSKMLLKIADQESASGCSSIRMPDADVIEQLVAASHGDIRAAINALQFYCQTSVNDVGQLTCGPTTHTKRKYDRKKKVAKTSDGSSKKPKVAGDSDSSICGRDSMLTLFHAVGKVLHCKRDGTMSPGDDLLPDHMSNLRRRLLLVDPEDIADKVHLTAEQFVAFLHQNFIDFHTEMDDVVSTASYLSDCEILTTNWTTKQLLQSYSVSVATRGCLFNMPNGPTAVGWKPLHKPQLTDVNRKISQQTASTQDLFASYHLPSACLHTELFPYLLMNAGRCGLSRAQAVHIEGIARLSVYAFTGCARLERLSERDAAMLDDATELSEFAGASTIASADNQHAVSNADSSQLHPVDYVDNDVVIEDFDD